MHKTLEGRTCRVTSQARNCLFHRRKGAKGFGKRRRGRRSPSPRVRARTYKTYRYTGKPRRKTRSYY